MKPIRITEVGQMGKCEKAWEYRYVKDVPDPPNAAMTKGTLLHAIYAAWWKHGQPAALTEITADQVLAEIDPERHDEVANMDPQAKDDAFWLMLRFAVVYGGEDVWELVESELELEAEVDGLLLQGRADALFRHKPSGDLYLGECKSMKDWRRLDILEVDPQMTHYYLLCQASGYPIKGILYDALKTYRWKGRDTHPPEDSVRRLFIHRTAEQCEASLDDLHAFNDRRLDIMSGARKPLRNITHFGSCSFCTYRPQCWEELAFPDTEVRLVP